MEDRFLDTASFVAQTALQHKSNERYVAYTLACAWLADPRWAGQAAPRRGPGSDAPPAPAAAPPLAEWLVQRPHRTPCWPATATAPACRQNEERPGVVGSLLWQSFDAGALRCEPARGKAAAPGWRPPDIHLWAAAARCASWTCFSCAATASRAKKAPFGPSALLLPPPLPLLQTSPPRRRERRRVLSVAEVHSLRLGAAVLTGVVTRTGVSGMEVSLLLQVGVAPCRRSAAAPWGSCWCQQDVASAGTSWCITLSVMQVDALQQGGKTRAGGQACFVLEGAAQLSEDIARPLHHHKCLSNAGGALPCSGRAEAPKQRLRSQPPLQVSEESIEVMEKRYDRRWAERGGSGT